MEKVPEPHEHSRHRHRRSREDSSWRRSSHTSTGQLALVLPQLGTAGKTAKTLIAAVIKRGARARTFRSRPVHMHSGNLLIPRTLLTSSLIASRINHNSWSLANLFSTRHIVDNWNAKSLLRQRAECGEPEWTRNDAQDNQRDLRQFPLDQRSSPIPTASDRSSQNSSKTASDG